MRTFKTNTGIGYIREISSGRIISRCDIPLGEHNISDGFEFVQVNTRSELAAVSVAVDAEAENLAADLRAIDDKLKAIAINELRTKDGYTFRSELFRVK